MKVLAPAGEASPRVTTFLLTPLAWLIGAIFTLPLAWVLVGSFRPDSEILTSNALTPRFIIPSSVGLEHYSALFRSGFLGALRNSFLVTGIGTAAGLVVCTLAGFALSAMTFRGRQVVFALVVIGFTVPVDATAFSLLSLARGWGLGNSYFGLILPFAVDGMAIFLVRQFFLDIPRELLEAAKIDGAGWGRILVRIYIPLAKPALIGAALILLIGFWQAYLWPILVIQDPGHYTAPVELVNAASAQYTTDWGEMFAGSVILILLPAAFLLPLQRYFTQSIATTGLSR